MELEMRDPSDPRPGEFAGALVVAVILHLLLLIPVALWTEASRAESAARREPEPIVVQLEPVPPPTERIPAAAVPVPPTEEPPPAEEPPEESPDEPQPPPPEESLLGWTTKGDEPGEAERPPGEEAAQLGLPEPGEGAEVPSPEPVAPRPEGPRGEPQPRALPEQPERPQPADSEPTPLPAERDGAPEESGSGAEPLSPGETGPAPGRPAAPRPLPVPESPPPSRRTEPQPLREAPDARRPGPKPLDPNDYEVGGAFGDIQFESRDYNWSEYSSKVYWAIYRKWLEQLYRATERGAFARDQSLGQLPDLDGEVWIRFSIDRQGNVSGIEVLKASPVASLDQASASALASAVLVPLPDDFPRDSERVTFRFEIRGFPDESTLRWNLRNEKAGGRF